MGGKKRRGIIAVIQGRRPCGRESDSRLIRKSLYAYRVRHGGCKGVCAEWNAIAGRGKNSNADGHPFVVWSLANGWERGKCLVNTRGADNNILDPSSAAWCFRSVKKPDGSVEIVR